MLMLKAYAKARPKTSALDDSLQDLWHVSLTASDQRAQGNKLTGVSGLARKLDTLMVPFWGNQVAGMRGGAVFHMSAISAGVRPWAWLMMSLSVCSRFRVSAARARAGSMARLYYSRRA